MPLENLRRPMLGIDAFTGGLDTSQNFINSFMDNLRKNKSSDIEDSYKQAMTQNYGRLQNLSELQKALLQKKIENANISIKDKPRINQAQIDALTALTNQRKGLGSGAPSSVKNINALKLQIKSENPSFTDRQIEDLANAYIGGQETTSSGQKVPQISEISGNIVDQIIKSGSTAPIITQGLRAKQAESEISTLNKYAQKAIEPYGDLYSGMSPQQIQDSFKSDVDSQRKLGQYIAANALQYEIAQNRIRLAKGQPGVKTTHELMNLSKQGVNMKFPKLSVIARKEASDYMDKALSEALVASQRSGTSARSARGYADNKNIKTDENGEQFYDVKPENRISQESKIDKSQINEENIAYTMQQTGLSRNDVMKKLKEKGLI